ncbi:MAG: hypothetical protein Greene07147_649 [Parcubacteria group bacterium Greene0714_7]|nr:MAG: hypothetical protein Greene07147_649 [Parcubacteria group bacterium Greene0714_7]
MAQPKSERLSGGLLEEVDSHPRGAFVERQLEVPTLKTLPRTSGQPVGTRVSHFPRQEPSVIFVSSRTGGPKERNILGSAGHGLLRFIALPTGVLAFIGGMTIDTVIISGMVTTGVAALSAPLLALLVLGTSAVIGGVKLVEFATGKK